VRGWGTGAFSTLSVTRWHKRGTEWERESP
jgi:hypothetical protein